MSLVSVHVVVELSPILHSKDQRDLYCATRTIYLIYFDFV